MLRCKLDKLHHVLPRSGRTGHFFLNDDLVNAKKQKTKKTTQKN